MSRPRPPWPFFPLVAALFITALLAVQPSGIFGTYDFERMHEPYREDFRQAIFAGEWPWWNPYTALGRPYFADIETATLYPTTWLVLLLGVKGGLLVTIIIHFAAAIDGTRRLAGIFGVERRLALACGVSFALSGALFSRIQSGQIQFFCVVCLWPYLWTSALRLQDNPSLRSTLLAAGALAVSILAGSPQILWAGVIALIPLLLVRSPSIRSAVRTALLLGAAGGIAVAMTAIQVAPFIELVQQGNRPLNDPHFAIRHGEEGLSWLSVVFPPGPWLRVNWEFNLGVGLVALLGACAAIAVQPRRRDVWALACVVVLLAVLALGEGSPVLPALTQWVPGFSSIRYPSRYGLGAVLATVVLFHIWLNHRAVQENRSRSAWMICGVHFVLLVAGAFAQGLIYRSLPTPRHEHHIRADLAAAGLPADGAPARAMLPESLLRANGGASAGVSTLVGFNNPALNRTWTSLYVLAREELPDFHRTNVIDAVQGRLWDFRGFFGVSVDAAPPDYQVNYHAPGSPRAFLSANTARVESWREALEKVRDGHDFVAEPLVEAPVLAGVQSGSGTISTEARIIRFQRNRVAVAYSSAAPALLVLAEAWYPGWTAIIDGENHAVIPVNGWMRGVTVPAGEHTVEFKFRPTRLWLWAAVSLLGTISFAVLLRRTRPAH
jgi:hypothetical protein